MSKRKSPKARELPLFDLPLHANDEVAAPPPDAVPIADAGDLPLADSGPDRHPEKPRREGEELRHRPESASAAADSGEAGGAAAAGDLAPEQAAPLGDRFLSGVLDLGIQLLVLGGAVASVRAMGVPLGLADGMPFVALALIFSLLYWFIPLAFWGQTPGMAWVGNSALSLSDEPLTFSQTALRWLGALLTLALAGLPLLLALGGRSLTDRMSESKTVVT